MLLNVIVRRNRKSLQYTYFKKHAIYSVFKTRKRKTSVLGGGASIYIYVCWLCLFANIFWGQIQLESSGQPRLASQKAASNLARAGREKHVTEATLRRVYDKAGWSLKLYDLLVLNAGNGWEWSIITNHHPSNPQPHPFPTFSTSKMKLANHHNQVKFRSQCQVI